MPYRTPGISVYSNLYCGNTFAETTRVSRTCLAVLRASISPEIALLLCNKSGHGNVGPVDHWVIGLWWEVQDDPLHILQLQERITTARLYGLNPENSVHS